MKYKFILVGADMHNAHIQYVYTLINILKSIDIEDFSHVRPQNDHY